MRIGKYEGSESSAGTAITFLLIGLGLGCGGLLLLENGAAAAEDLRRSYDDALGNRLRVDRGGERPVDDVVEKGGDIADELRSKARPLSDLLRRS